MYTLFDYFNSATPKLWIYKQADTQTDYCSKSNDVINKPQDIDDSC